jgi:hypothetical protein
LATALKGGFFAPFDLDDVQPDLGDSAIMESFGLGGRIAHVSPEIAMNLARPWKKNATDVGHRVHGHFRSKSRRGSARLLPYRRRIS